MDFLSFCFYFVFSFYKLFFLREVEFMDFFTLNALKQNLGDMRFSATDASYQQTFEKSV